MDDRAPTIVVVGASAGGVEALTTLADGLPEDIDAAVCVVLHMSPDANSKLAEIISRAGPLSAVQAKGGEPLGRGRIYVAPPDRHLTVSDSHVVVDRGPHENELRPSIDVLFRSAALTYGRRTVAVVLSGTGDDGVAGASAVGAQGGCVFVQDPEDARFATLPAYAVARDNPDRILPLSELPSAVAGVVHQLSQKADVRENVREEMSLDAVVSSQRASVETALWTALRALHERAEVVDRLAERVGNAGAERSRRRFEAIAAEAREQAETIRRVLAGRDGPEG